MTALSGTSYDITFDDQRVTVAEVGAGLRRYTVGGVDVTVPYGDDELPPKGCGTTLVPWPNRIRDGRYTFDGVEQQLALTEPDAHNAIHGLGRWARWSPVTHEPDEVTLALDVVPQKGYPYQVHAEVTYSLRRRRGLTVTLAARNDGTHRAPFGAGSHPYLSTRGTPLDDVSLGVPADDTFDVDEQLIPIRRRPVRADEDFSASTRLGARRLDQGFTGLEIEDWVPDDRYGMSQVYAEGWNTALWYDPAFTCVQVYTVDEVTPGFAGIAIEPMTCPADAFNSGAGLIVLEPGETWSATWGIFSS